jgi:hypothetical protein
MNSVVILNLQADDAELVKRMKYNLEKAGFSLTESYTSGVASEKQSNAGILADTLIFVYNKTYEKS